MDESESEKRCIRDIDILNRSNSQNKRTRDIGQKKRTNKIGIINTKHFVAKFPMIRISFPLEILIKYIFLCMLGFLSHNEAWYKAVAKNARYVHFLKLHSLNRIIQSTSQNNYYFLKWHLKMYIIKYLKSNTLTIAYIN